MYSFIFYPRRSMSTLTNLVAYHQVVKVLLLYDRIYYRSSHASQRAPGSLTGCRNLFLEFHTNTAILNGESCSKLTANLPSTILAVIIYTVTTTVN